MIGQSDLEFGVETWNGVWRSCKTNKKNRSLFVFADSCFAFYVSPFPSWTTLPLMKHRNYCGNEDQKAEEMKKTEKRSYAAYGGRELPQQ